MKPTIIAIIVAVFFISILGVSADFTDTLEGDDIEHTGDWDYFQFTYKVSPNTDSSWHYEYWASVDQYEISHLDLELTEGFDENDFFNFQASSPVEPEIGWHQPFQGNLHMPESFYGIKFDKVESTDFHFSFDSYKSARTW